MTYRHLYVFALWLPLMLLVLISVGEAMLKQFGWHEMSSATGYFILSGVMGGIQYLLFAAAITWRFASMDEDFLRRVSWAMPMIFFPICFVGLWVFFQLAHKHAIQEQVLSVEHVQQDILAFCIRLGVYSVLGGYVYVGCTHGLAWALNKCGLMEDSEI